jgi:periplasmic protein TonB
VKNLSESRMADDPELFEPVDQDWDDLDEPLRGACPSVLEPPPRENILKFAVIASLLVHLGFFVGIPSMAALGPRHPPLNPDDIVTPVRLVDEPQEPTAEPPTDTDAISDVNHKAEIERKPKTPPFPNPGVPSPQQQPTENKTASIAPPVAPEVVEKPEKMEPKAQPKEQSKKEPSPEKPGKETPKPEVSPKSQSAAKSKDNHRQQTKAVKPSQQKKPDSKRVDLRPTQQEIFQGTSPPGGPTSFHPDGDIEEEVVDINTKEHRFASYLEAMKQKIQLVSNYPRAAAEAGLGGSPVVEFTIEKTGTLTYVRLLGSSGHIIIDEAAQRAIRTAAPFHPFPESIRTKKLRVRGHFIYD